jgi:hypothetical protein
LTKRRGPITAGCPIERLKAKLKKYNKAETKYKSGWELQAEPFLQQEMMLQKWLGEIYNFD